MREDDLPAEWYTFYHADYEVPDGRSIKEAHRYWIKWDRLYIVWEEGQEPIVRVMAHSSLGPYPSGRPTQRPPSDTAHGGVSSVQT